MNEREYLKPGTLTMNELVIAMEMVQKKIDFHKKEVKQLNRFYSKMKEWRFWLGDQEQLLPGQVIFDEKYVQTENEKKN